MVYKNHLVLIGGTEHVDNDDEDYRPEDDVEFKSQSEELEKFEEFADHDLHYNDAHVHENEAEMNGVEESLVSRYNEFDEQYDSFVLDLLEHNENQQQNVVLPVVFVAANRQKKEAVFVFNILIHIPTPGWKVAIFLLVVRRLVAQ